MDQPPPTRVAAAPPPDCPGLIAAWRFRPGAAPEPLDDGAALDAVEAGAEGLWLHLNLTDQRSRLLLARLPLPPHALAALTEPDDGAHLTGEAGALFGAVPDFLFEGPGTEMGMLHLALTPGLLVTARRHPLREVHEVAQGGPGGEAPAAALAAILRRTADGMGRALHAIGQDLTRVEEALLRGDAAGHRSVLAGLRRRTLLLERGFAPGAEALCALAEDEAEEEVPAMPFARPVLREARRQAAVLRAVAALKERARIAQDEMGDLASEQINRSLFVLSVISAAMLPASLVAGIFGMNVGSLPGVEEEWGFVMAMGLIGASILAILGALRLWKML